MKLNQKQIEETGKAIRPVNRKKQISYKGNCPYCAARQ